MQTFARSTRTAYVTATDIAAMEISLPPPDRQQALAAALRALDDEVTATRDLAAEIAAARDAITCQLFGSAR
jgi:restriction endonuclease S subunit